MIKLLHKMNSNEINIFVDDKCIPHFLGVFAADELDILPYECKGLLVVNTDISSRDGEHWIAIHIEKNNIFYYDSLLTNFHQSEYITTFIKKMKRNFVFNTIQIQSEFSETCGNHCLVFCYIMAKGKGDNLFTRFLKLFHPLNVPQREHLSILFYKEILQNE